MIRRDVNSNHQSGFDSSRREHRDHLRRIEKYRQEKEVRHWRMRVQT